MITTLPVTLLILVVKLVLVHIVGFDGLIKFSDIGLVITGGLFLIGFMVAGTMSDYKESEKLPSELSSILESIEDSMTLSYRFKGGFDFAAQKKQLFEVTSSIINWFTKSCSTEEVFHKINGITDIALALETVGTGPAASKVLSEQNNLRKTFSRVNVIRKTNFLSTGYALLEVLALVIICLLMIGKFESELVRIIIVCFITQIFVYMLRLIKDIDEPFEYSPDGVPGAADVDLFPLFEYKARAKERL